MPHSGHENVFPILNSEILSRSNLLKELVYGPFLLRVEGVIALINVSLEHYTIFVDFSYKSLSNGWPRVPKWTVWLYDKPDWDAFSNFYRKLHWKFLFHENDAALKTELIYIFSKRAVRSKEERLRNRNIDTERLRIERIN